MSDAKVVISQETVVKNYAEVLVNGQSKGKREINGHPSLREFCEGLAEEFGVKTFTVSLDGKPVTSSSQADAPIQGGAAVGLHAKDSRGSRNKKGEGSDQQAKPAPQPTDAPMIPAEAGSANSVSEPAQVAEQPMAATEQATETPAPAMQESASTEQASEQTTDAPHSEADAPGIKT